MWKRFGILLSVGWMALLSFHTFQLKMQVENSHSSLPSFATCAPAQPAPTIQNVAQQEKQISFPHAIEGYPIALQTLMIYEGPFREDGSDDPVSNTAALILQNTGDADILSVCVQLRQGEQSYTFEAFCIPAGARVMVVEKNQKEYSPLPVTSCKCVSLETGNLEIAQDRLLLEPVERCDLLLTNLTEDSLDVLLIYKLYMPSQDLYMGGIAYSLKIIDLKPGESRMVRPYPFTWSGGRILATQVQINETGAQ